MRYIIKGCENTPHFNEIIKKCVKCEFKYGSNECITFIYKHNMNIRFIVREKNLGSVF